MPDDEPEIEARRLTALARIASALNVPVAVIYAGDHDHRGAIERTIGGAEVQTRALVQAFGSIRDPVIREECLAFLRSASQRDLLMHPDAPGRIVNGI